MRQTYEQFMDDHGADPERYRRAFDDARAARRLDWGPGKGIEVLDGRREGDRVTYSTEHLMWWWDQVSVEALAERLTAWVGEDDGKWQILERRLGYPGPLVDFIHRTLARAPEMRAAGALRGQPEALPFLDDPAATHAVAGLDDAGTAGVDEFGGYLAQTLIRARHRRRTGDSDA
ncbi:hypothetical protein [Saccharothrix syringae]|uniref:Uncharacterized protein n=1 Tax=Saccharothrix syringae TaxID=103733 RepID=A0A5Q0H2Q7_SACSY|nr:hypothetical protein [Saccharothrix syringae]QFZ20471.1 hypothetical protein EKG83_26390 [Saccharothrix syringae]